MDAVDSIIQRFGGLTKLSRETGWPVSTIQSWKGLKHIPMRRWATLLKKADDLKVELTEAELFAASKQRSEAAE